MYGEIHNQVVDAIGNDPNFLGNSNAQNIIIAQNWASSNYPSIDISTAPQSFPVPTTLSNIIANENFSDDANAFVEILEIHILDYLSTSSYTFGQLETNLIDFENDVFSSSIPTHEKEFIIGVSVIGRFSGAYWSNVGVNSSEPWHSAAIISHDNGSFFHPAFTAAIEDGDVLTNPGPPSPSLAFPWRLYMDLTTYALWSVDCDDLIQSDACRKEVGFRAGIVSSWFPS